MLIYIADGARKFSQKRCERGSGFSRKGGYQEGGINPSAHKANPTILSH